MKVSLKKKYGEQLGFTNDRDKSKEKGLEKGKELMNQGLNGLKSLF